MERLVHTLKLLIKFGAPLSLLLIPVVAVYGWIMPWHAIQPELERYAGQTPILVGASYRANYTNYGSTALESRSYIMVPSVFGTPRLVTFAQVNHGPVTVTQSATGLVLIAGWWMLCGFCTWWFWRHRAPSNNSFQRTPTRYAGGRR